MKILRSATYDVALACALMIGFGSWLLFTRDLDCTQGLAAPTSVPLSAPTANKCIEVAHQPPGRKQALPSPAEALDPCASVSDENDRRAKTIARLRTQIELIKSHDGITPYDYFLQSPDAALVIDSNARLWLKHLMASECPFYLLPGEAAHLVGNRDTLQGYDSFEEMMIRFLGPDRVLRDAPPWWVADMADLLLPDEWVSIFGTKHPS